MPAPTITVPVTDQISRLEDLETQTNDALAANFDNIEGHKNSTDNPHSVSKGQVGLGNVDNTSDADKPISTATQTALDGKATAAQGAKADSAVQPDALGTAASEDVGAFATAAQGAEADAARPRQIHADDRPGDNPGAFSTVLTGAGADKPALSGDTVAVAGGLAFQRSGAGVIALRNPVALAGDVIEITARFRRTANPADPNNHAILLRAAWLDRDKAQVGAVQTLATASDALTSSGMVSLSARVSALDVTGAIAPPAGAAYACFYLQTYGEDGVTAVETLRAREITDLALANVEDVSAAVAAANAAAEAAQEAAALVNRETLETRGDVASWTPAAGTGVITVQGGASRGDGLGGEWYLDGDDTASAADGSDVLVDQAGGRWKRIEVRKAIALPSAAIMQVSGAVEAGATVVTPEGTWDIVAAGSYTANGDTVRDHGSLAVQAVLSKASRLSGVAALLADTRDYGFFTTGDLLRTEQGFEYEVEPVLASSDWLVTTAAGVKLKPLRHGAPLLAEQFGTDPTGATPSTAALQAWLSWLQEFGGMGRAGERYLVDFPGSPADPLGLAALFLAPQTSGPPTEIDFSGSRWSYEGDSDTALFRFFQSENQAYWPKLFLRGGFFDGSGTTDPFACIVWDDMGESRTEGMHFHGWQRDAGDENAVCIEQRNVDSWSENCKHTNHIVTSCDAIWRSSLVPGGGGTYSMARTELGPFFCSGLKAFGIINTMAMYDSVIHGPVGNSGRIAWVRNSGGAVANTEVEGLKTEQGRPAITASGGAITAGSNTLTVASGTPFQSWMAQGQRVVIPGAGAGGADMETWITGVTSATEVTVYHSAATTVSGASLTLRATASVLEAGALQKFALHKVYNRDGGRSSDELQYTGATSGYAAIPMGALSVLGSGTFGGGVTSGGAGAFAGGVSSNEGGATFGGTVTGGKFATVNKQEFSGTVTLDGANSATWVKVLDGDGDPVQANRALVEATVVLAQQLYAVYRVSKLGDTGVDGGGLVTEKRNSGTYSQPLEIRINGTELEMRSAADLAAWRGVTLRVDVTRYQ